MLISLAFSIGLLVIVTGLVSKLRKNCVISFICLFHLSPCTLGKLKPAVSPNLVFILCMIMSLACISIIYTRIIPFTQDLLLLPGKPTGSHRIKSSSMDFSAREEALSQSVMLHSTNMVSVKTNFQPIVNDQLYLFFTRNDNLTLCSHYTVYTNQELGQYA